MKKIMNKTIFTTIRVDVETLKKVKQLTNVLKLTQPIAKGTIRHSDAINYIIDEFYKSKL